jgi:lipopolysaccharide/colanic/teichoic acid biosynthesis glycosyltransferase
MKRLFDLCASFVALVILAPLLLFIAAWIKTDSRGPVFFRQTRVGLRGRPFRIHKFRTMRTEQLPASLQITVGADPRITRAGAFLRRYKLDELPQFIDVLAGRMSVVGPRPEVPKYMSAYPPEIRDKVLSVRPGITDWASVRFRSENEILAAAADPERAYIEEILPVKQQYYLRYVETHTLRDDLRVILETVRVALKG